MVIKASLESLATGARIKIKIIEKRIYIPYGDDFENPKKPEITSWEDAIKEVSFGWRDLYKEMKVIVLASWDQSEYIRSYAYPLDLVSEDNGFYLVNLPDYKYIHQVLCDGVEHKFMFQCSYNLFESQFARILGRAMDNRTPSQYEIESFRESKPYHDIFKTTPFTESFSKNSGI